MQTDYSETPCAGEFRERTDVPPTSTAISVFLPVAPPKRRHTLRILCHRFVAISGCEGRASLLPSRPNLARLCV